MGCGMGKRGGGEGGKTTFLSEKGNEETTSVFREKGRDVAEDRDVLLLPVCAFWVVIVSA